MKNIIIKFICVITCMVALCFGTAYAAYEQTGDITMTVRGDLGAEYANKMVSIDVFYERGKWEDFSGMNKQEYLSHIVCHDQTTADSEGEYTFVFDINGPTGMYTAWVSVEGDFEPFAEELYYVNMVDYGNAVDRINSLTTGAEIAVELETSGEYLGFVSEEYDALSNKAFAMDILLSFKEEGKDLLSKEDGGRDAGIAIFNKAVFVASLNEKRVTNVFTNENALLDETDIKDWYNKSFVTEELQVELTERLSGKGFKSYKKYKDAISEAFVLATVKEPNGYINIKEVLTHFAKQFNLKLSGITSSDYRELAGIAFKDMDALKDKLSELGEGSGNSSGGGGGGGNKGDSNDTLVTDPVVIADEKTPVAPEKIEPEIFKDVKNIEWAKDAIVSLAEKGVLNGKSDGLFYPYDNVTREEFVKIIVKAFEVKGSGADTVFADVNKNEWFAPYVSAAYESGIVNGIGSNLFGAGQKITRQDLAVMAYQAGLKSGISFNENDSVVFKDDDHIADYAKDAIYALKSYGVIDGKDNGCFEPNSYATRAESAKIVWKLMNL